MPELVMKVLALVVTLAVECLHGLPQGAPRGACDNMTPGHYGAQQLTNTPERYRLTSQNTAYLPGEAVIVTLESVDGTTFSGFLLQGRDGDTPVGEFECQTEACHGVCGHNNTTALTHSLSFNQSSITATWLAPIQSNATIRFRATVVESYSTFIVGIESEDVTVMAEYMAETSLGTSTPGSGESNPTAANSDGNDGGNGAASAILAYPVEGRHAFCGRQAQKKGMGPQTGRFNVVGHAMHTRSDGTTEDAPGEEQLSPLGAAAASASTLGVAVAWPSQPNSPKDLTMVDCRHHDAERSAMAQDNDKKLKAREGQIEALKDELRQREKTVKSLTDENHKKRSDINSLQHTINALKQDVDASKTYVEDIQHNLAIMQVEKEKLESGAAYREKEALISRLTHEVTELKNNLNKLDRELSKAKEVIAQQGGKLRLLENDKTNLHVKFKEELSKATQNMRLEVEKMREVMRSQWEEMRILRQQNEGMRTDIKEIKDMLLGGEPSGDPPIYNMGALKPSLPALSRDTRRIIPGKKKPLG
ncbi:hypothetical protein BaRGS_00007607 [Batillaria attramentaria]|uniref:Reelin domain-containing protein n=1 Tax=Batillaria attramentaria TaxID=370345 RepID=A0ABD0LNE1_9CAEN